MAEESFSLQMIPQLKVSESRLPDIIIAFFLLFKFSMSQSSFKIYAHRCIYMPLAILAAAEASAALARTHAH